MRLALAHDHLFQIGGAENVLRQFTRLYPDRPLYTLICDDRSRKYFSATNIVTSYLHSLPGGHFFFKYFLPLMPSAWERFDFSQFDVVLSSSSGFVKGLITQPRAIHITYCHSPTRYLWSDSDEYMRGLRLIAPVKFALSQILSRLRLYDRLAADRVDYFIANSRFVAERIQKYYHRESTIIYPPIEVDRFHQADDLGDYYLLISRLRPYKRVDLAIKAFNALRLPLVIIGSGEEQAYLRQLAKPNVTFLGEVSDEERNKYLSRCRALIHPQEEDFGITVIEAMASGRPVIAYGSGGALETIESGVTGVFFQEQEWEALADAVMNFKCADFDPELLRERSRQYDAINFRQQINDFVNSVCPLK